MNKNFFKTHSPAAKWYLQPQYSQTGGLLWNHTGHELPRCVHLAVGHVPQDPQENQEDEKTRRLKIRMFVLL